MKIDPVIFCEGTTFFNNVVQRYTVHKTGLFILTPSGAGKTHYCKRQTVPNWIDGDDLWLESGAQPAGEWWDMGVPVINAVEQRCDIITAQAVDRGLRILGSINYWLKPDAIVIPDWEVLVDQIQRRQDSGEYDGGMTSAHHAQLKIHIGIINEWHTKHAVPKFKSVTQAIEHLSSND